MKGDSYNCWGYLGVVKPWRLTHTYWLSQHVLEPMLAHQEPTSRPRYPLPKACCGHQWQEVTNQYLHPKECSEESVARWTKQHSCIFLTSKAAPVLDIDDSSHSRGPISNFHEKNRMFRTTWPQALRLACPPKMGQLLGPTSSEYKWVHPLNTTIIPKVR